MPAITPTIFNDEQKRIVDLHNDQGFGLEDDAHLNAKKKFAIKVSDKMSYCISFWFKQKTVDPCLELSVRGFNCDFEKELFTRDVVTGMQTKFFITASTRAITTPEKYHFARFILYAADFPTQASQPKTSLAAGTNLIMGEGTSKIFVNLVCRNFFSTDDVHFDIRSLKIWNFKVRPLSTPFSTGFVQTTNLLEIWRKNNRKQLTDQQIDNIAENYLMPYNSIQAVINL